MHRTAIPPAPGREFDTFLFALVGEDSSGMPLSVVSVLARMDLDPWQEASALADLPEDAAALRLADLLIAIPDASLRHGERSTIATRLITLLRRDSIVPAKAPRPPFTITFRVRTLPRLYALLLALLIFMVVLFHETPSSDGLSVPGPSPSTPLP